MYEYLVVPHGREVMPDRLLSRLLCLGARLNGFDFKSVYQ